MDFEAYMNATTKFTATGKSQIRGRVGKINPTNDASVNIKFKVGNAMHLDNAMIRCDYTNTTCYKARAVPVIYSIDYTQGYTSGGQQLTIKGYGFASENISTMIDGAPCTVLTSEPEQLTCVTSEQPVPSS